MPKDKILKGRNVKGAFDFSYGMLRIVDKRGVEYRMSTEELNKILKQHDYDATFARKYHHLKVK